MLRFRNASLYVLCLAMLMVSMDQYIVVVALPDIAKDLGYSAQTLQAVVSAYAIASGGFLLLGGRAADLLGRRRVLLAGLTVYLLASLAGGLATEPFQQLAARAFQGLGGALVFPSTLALVNAGFKEGPERNQALGRWSGAGAGGLVLGVLLGGLLTSQLTWRWVFLINIPLAAGAIAAALALIERDGPRDRKRKFDALGSGAITAAATMLIVALVEGPNLGWTSFATLALAAAGFMLALTFVVVERRSSDPLMPPALIANPWLRLAIFVGSAFMATFGAALYFLSIYFQTVLGYDALTTGLAFLIPTAVVVASSAFADRAVSGLGLWQTMIYALAIGLAGAAALAVALEGEPSFIDLLPGLIGLSLGDGALFTATFIAAAKGVPNQQQGVAAGIVSTGQSMGAALGLACLVLVANSASGVTAGEAAAVPWVAEGVARALFAIAGGIGITLLALLYSRRSLVGDG